MISYELDDDEEAVIEAARQLAESADPWAALNEGGWLDLLLDDADSGLGYLGFVAEELGAAGVAVPLAATAAAWPSLFGTSAGARRVAFVEDGWSDDAVGAEVVVSGGEAYEQFEVEGMGGLDGDALGTVRVTGAPVASASGDPDVAAQRATALVVAEMAGLLRRVRDMTLEHVRQREQFGQPLAALQVIQHGAARLATLAEAATWAGRWATHACGPESVHAAKGWISAAAQEASALAHQMHGAIGFTQEYGLQRLTKRLRTLRFTAGDDREHHVALGGLRARG